MNSKRKTPWPTKAVMTQIYEQHLWGGNDSDFYSGEGSHDLEIVEPYIESVTEFLKSHNNTLKVCDLGCGDFNIGKHLVEFTSHYCAIDIVENLIERNKTIFQDERLQFQYLDISKDKLPEADCYILRQVLQHLSNKEIQNIIKNLPANTYVIVTEHIPNGPFEPNLDMIASQGNRLKLKSGVDLLQPPFNLKIQKQEILNRVILEENEGQILTMLFKLGTNFT